MVKKDPSQLDPGGVLKSAHDFETNSFRMINGGSSVPHDYTRSIITYNAQGSVTVAEFYKGSAAEERQVTFVSDIAGNLNNTYFTLASEENKSTYYIWYNVDSTGTDPNIAGSTGVEINIQSNDDRIIVTLATKMALSNIDNFIVTNINNYSIKIKNVELGITAPIADNGTGFTFTTLQQGSEKLLKRINIPYDGMVKYVFNDQEKKFAVEPVSSATIELDVDADNGANIAISRHEQFRNITDSVDFLDSDLSTNTFTEIWEYVATENLRTRVIKIKADTFGEFRIKVNGQIQDYFLTSPTQRNCNFLFIEDLDVPNTQSLTVEFRPERLRILNLNFFFRVEGYVK